MRRAPYVVFHSAALLIFLLFGATGLAVAGALDPLGFQSLGAFPTAAGTYDINTYGPNPTLSGPGGTALTGVVFNGIAVFDFDSITVGSGQTFVGRGSLPLALLSHGDATINGLIDVSAPRGVTSLSGPGGFDGGSGAPGTGGFGPGGGGAGEIISTHFPQSPSGPPTTNYSLFGGGGGGGFGGSGYAGMPVSVPGAGAAGGGSGGRAYADLLGQLQGGSGGAVGLNAPGGGGGGAIELGAVGKISITGSILANGGSASSLFAGGGGGGGAGGGILLHGEGVTLSGLLSVIGGNGGPGGGDSRSFPLFLGLWGAGGNGGGGQVVINPGASGFTNTGGTIDVGNGTFSVVPEPASLVLFGLGLLGVLGFPRYARRLKAV